MTLTEIRSASDPLYADVAASYAASFPINEQRTPEQQAEAFADTRYRLLAWHDGKSLIAFMGCWTLSQCLYVEHFAVEQTQRGKGTGSAPLSRFCRETATTIILEIDPPDDDISRRRLRFYERIGFRHNGFSHLHPPYRQGFTAHSLHIMSYPRLLTDSEYAAFCTGLTHTVMHLPHGQNRAKS